MRGVFQGSSRTRRSLVAGVLVAFLGVLVVASLWLRAPERDTEVERAPPSLAHTAALEAGWVRLPGRRELILDLRRAAAAAPGEPFASGALAQERLEAAARAIMVDPAAALRELEAAEEHLTRALLANDEHAVILAAHGVCALLRDDALTRLARTGEAAEARATAQRAFATASELDAGAVGAVAWWNQGLLDERRGLIAVLSGDSSLGEIAQDDAARARARAQAAAGPDSALAALLAADPASR